MKYNSILILIALSLVLTTEMFGAQGGPVSKSELEKAADVIVVGSSRIVSRNGLSVSIEITVSRSLKGGLNAGDKVNALWAAQSNFSAQNAPSKSVSGLWFLKSKGQIDWNILPFATGDIRFEHTHIPISNGEIASDFSYKADAPTMDKVIYEIGAEIEKSRLERSGFESVLLRDLFIDITESVSPSDPMLLPRLYTRFANSSLPPIKALGLRGMIKRGDIESLAQVVKDKTMVKELGEELAFNDAICTCRGQDPLLITSLATLAAAENSIYLRRCAAQALRAIHTRETLPHLAQLLDSDHVDLRYAGMAGLASFANNLPMQTPQNV